MKIGLLALGATLAAPVWAELSAEQLAKMAQNPIGNLISLPFVDDRRHSGHRRIAMSLA
jgi:hypothetical protein